MRRLCLFFIAIFVACSRDKPVERTNPEALPQNRCAAASDRLAALIADAPREAIVRSSRFHRGAETKDPWSRVGGSDAPLFTMTNEGVAWWGWERWIGFAEPQWSAAVDRLAASWRDYDAGLLLLYPDARTTTERLALARDLVRQVEIQLGRSLDLRLLALVRGGHARFEIPQATPGWARERIADIRSTGEMWTALTKEALTRAAPGCPEAVMAGVTVVDEGQTERQPEQEERMLAELAACGCRGVDMDAFTGLMLGLVGYRNPLGWVRLATRPDAAHRVTLPRTATVQALVSAWPADAGDQPVWVEVE